MSKLKHLIQDEADNRAALAKLKAEGRALSVITERTAAQETRLTAILKTELTALENRDAEIAQELVHARRLQDEERNAPTADNANGGNGSAPLVTRAKGRRFAEMFPQARLDLGGFASSEEYLATLHSGLADPRLVPAHAPRGLMATATGTVPSDGGFSVPTQVFAEWLDSSLESEIVRSRADVRPMTTSEAIAAGWDDADHSAELYGGFAGQWVEEDGAMTVQTPNMRNIKLKARKLALLASASNELIADGVGYESQLGMAITKALGWFLDRAFFNGQGAAAPMGIWNAPCTITVPKRGGQSAATIMYDNLTDMFARLHPASIANAVWVANSTAIPSLLTLGIPVGTGGMPFPVMSQANGEFRIFTRPVIFTEKAAAIGNVGDIGLYDFSQYVVGIRQEFQLAKSVEAGFTQDKSYYRGIIRVDGQPKLSAPVTPANGQTLSPFVVLAARG